jgi:hypothetical protein
MFQLEINRTNYKNVTNDVNEENTTVSFRTVIDMKNPLGIFSQLKDFF